MLISTILTYGAWVAFIFQSVALAIYCRKILKAKNIEAVSWQASFIFMLASLMTASFSIYNHVPLVLICASLYAACIEAAILWKVWHHEGF